MNHTAIQPDPEILKLATETATTAPRLIARANAALYLALIEKQNPGTCADAVVTYLKFLIAGGNEPHFDLEPNFFYPMVAATVAVSKATPTIFSALSAEDVEKLDMLMLALSALTAFGTDDECSYTSGPGGYGNYNKNWNPNYPLSNVPQIFFAVSYFGSAQAVNDRLAAFDYDTCIQKFEQWGWSVALEHWTHTVPDFCDPDGDGRGTFVTVDTAEDVGADRWFGPDQGLGLVEGKARVACFTTPRTMLMEGGPVYSTRSLARIGQYVGRPGGTGLGVPALGRKGYQYKGCKLDNIPGMWNYLLDYNYSAGVVTSKDVPDGNGGYLCYIVDGAPSPVEGLNGMMREFRSGRRSSVGYCQEDFILCTTVTAALEELGLYDGKTPENEERNRKQWVGNTDFLHKAEHGYVSFSGTAVRGAPKPEYGEGSSYTIWRAYWLTHGHFAYTLADFGKM